MYSKTFAIAALFSLAAADLKADYANVESNLKSVDDLVKAWSSAVGIQGALDIQLAIPKLSSAVVNLENNLPAGPLTSNEEAQASIESLGSLTTAVSALLADLGAKAADFNSVGSGSIVGTDITQLVGPSSNIASKIYNALPADFPCSNKDVASSNIVKLAGDFASAGSLYGLQGITYFSPAPCSGGAAATGSASASDSAAAATNGTAAATSAPAAAAGNNTLPNSSTTVYSTTLQTVCNTCTAVAPANGAAAQAMGAGAIALGAVAMLI